jgi:MFS family permease
LKHYLIEKYFQLHKFQESNPEILRRNLLLNIGDGTIFLFAMSFVSVTTILPVFIQRIGGNAIAIGALPVLWTLGLNFPQLFTHSRNPERFVKPKVLRYGFLFRISFLVTALIIFLFFKELDASVSVPVFLLLIFIIAIIGSVPVPGWYHLFSKTTPLKLRGRLLAIRQLLGSLLGSFSGSFIIIILSSLRYPNNFAALFLAASVFSFISWLFLKKVDEPDIPVTEDISFEQINKLKRIKQILKEDRNFRNFVIADALILISLSANGFYAAYAISKFNLPTSYAGSFTIIISGSMALGNIIFGYLGDRFGHKLNLVILASCSILAGLSALLSTNVLTFGIVFFFVAFTLCLQGISRISFVVEMCGESERTLYVAMLNSVTAPTAFFGLIAGIIISLFGFTVVFLLYIILSTIGVYWLYEHVIDPRLLLEKKTN